MEVIESGNAERPAVRCIAWLDVAVIMLGTWTGRAVRKNTGEQKNNRYDRKEKAVTDTGQRRNGRTVAHQEGGYDRYGKEEPENEEQTGNGTVSPDAVPHIVCSHEVRSHQLGRHEQKNENR